MWPPYYMQQRQMNPMGYPAEGIQVVTPNEVKFYNVLEELEKTEAEERRNRRRIVIGSLVIVAVVLIGRKIIKKSILS